MQQVFRSFIFLLTLTVAVQQAQSFFDIQTVSRTFTSCMKPFTTTFFKKQAIGPLFIIGCVLVPVFYSLYRQYKVDREQKSSSQNSNQEHASIKINLKKVIPTTENKTGTITILNSINQSDSSSCGYYALFNGALVYRDLQNENDPGTLNYSDKSRIETFNNTFYQPCSKFVKNSTLRKEYNDNSAGWLRGDELEELAAKELNKNEQKDCLVIDNVKQWLSADKNYQGFLDEHVQKLQNWYSSDNVTKILLISDSEQQTYGKYENHWIVCIAHKCGGNIMFYVLDSINGTTQQTRIVQQLCLFLSSKERFLNAKLAILISDPLDTINRLMPKAQHNQPVEDYNGTQEDAIDTILEKLLVLVTGVQDDDIKNAEAYRSFKVSLKELCSELPENFKNQKTIHDDVQDQIVEGCKEILGFLNETSTES